MNGHSVWHDFVSIQKKSNTGGHTNDKAATCTHKANDAGVQCYVCEGIVFVFSLKLVELNLVEEN